MREQHFGGFILSSVYDDLHNFIKSDEINGIDLNALLKSLCTFSVDYQIDTQVEIDPIAAVFSNIISRGLPTFPSLDIERKISEEFQIAYQAEDQHRPGSIIFKPDDNLPVLRDKIIHALFLIDPRIDPFNRPSMLENYSGYILSAAEEKFINSTLPESFGVHLTQLLEPQREITSIQYDYPGSGPYKQDLFKKELENFKDQRIDFAINLPITHGYTSSIAIEIDDPSHLDQLQKSLDEKRDRFLSKLGWGKTIRIETKNLYILNENNRKDLSNFLSHPYLTRIRENYDSPMFQDREGLDALQIALSPFAIARVQKSILLAVQKGILDLTQSDWKIAIIERDVPCGNLALRDLQIAFDHLFQLEGKNRKLPELSWEVFVTSEFADSALNANSETTLISNYVNDKQFDLIIDVSMLQRTGFVYPANDNLQAAKKVMVIRTAYSTTSKRKVVSSEPISYSVSEAKQDDPRLTYFLQNIFRKKAFLPGQVDILKRTLTLQNVVALLPTGAGKSLTYQLSSILQPGVTLVVDPIKSLMRDQDKSLKKSGIDATTFINSSLKSSGLRKKLSEDMRDGQFQFVFISPERLQIQEFRDHLSQMDGTFFSYCVIDEAHCVSEWGHDFRTSYLKLGENARKFCKVHKKIGQVALVGLTGTASFDVLEDVKRELFVEDSEFSVVRPLKSAREELNFKIEEIPDILVFDNTDKRKINKQVSELKSKRISKIIRELVDEDWDSKTFVPSDGNFLLTENDYPNAGIIFCPHVNWMHGVLHISEIIKDNFKELSNTIGIYAGRLADDGYQIDLEEVQDKFMRDELNLLVATKAFGMGIDKPNIRFTIHYSMPQSIESFYQEAGRAGRDKQKSYCYIVHSSTPIVDEYDEDNKDLSVDKKLMLSFHRNSFPGIKKEKTIIWELLNEVDTTKITLGDVFDVDELDFEMPISLNFWRKDGHFRIYANTEDGGSIGYISIDNQPSIKVEVKPANSAIDRNVAESVMNAYFDHLQKQCPSGMNLKTWLTTKTTQPGIERILEGLNFEGTATLDVPFENTISEQVSAYLNSWGLKFSPEEILKACDYCFSPDHFVDKLFPNHQQEGPTLDKNIQSYLKKQFFKIRNQQETFRAVHRLSIVGAIDDYSIDYRFKTVVLEITKRQDDYYVEKLISYINRYDKPEEVKKAKDEILLHEGETIIQKCCGYLTEFVYRTIAAKRRQAIDTMEDAIKSKEFTERVNSYFDSRYTSEIRGQILTDTSEWVWSFIEKEAQNQDNISHILGACDRLLDDNPYNLECRLLRAFARISHSSSAIKMSGIDDVHKARELLMSKTGSLDEYIRYLSRLYKKIKSYDERSARLLEPEFLHYHLSWLSKFNQNTQ